MPEFPIYLLAGRHDVNAPPELTEDYLLRLDAPHKALIGFEHSGHSSWVEESVKVVDVMVNTWCWLRAIVNGRCLGYAANFGTSLHRKVTALHKILRLCVWVYRSNDEFGVR